MTYCCLRPLLYKHLLQMVTNKIIMVASLVFHQVSSHMVMASKPNIRVNINLSSLYAPTLGFFSFITVNMSICHLFFLSHLLINCQYKLSGKYVFKLLENR